MHLIRDVAAVHRKLDRLSWFVIAAFLIVFVPLLVWLFWYSDPVRSTSRGFLNALAAADYGTAFDYCSPDLQETIGDAERLQQIAEKSTGFHRPMFWTRMHIGGDSAQLENSQEVLDRSDWAHMQLKKVGGAWKVTKFSSSNADGAALRIPPLGG